jgi:hypothetical protein
VTGQFAGQTALVTGATTGIGRVVAGQLATGGAHVVISGRDRSRAETARAAAAARGGSVDFVAADLADVGDVQRLAERALDLCEGHVDIVINATLYPHLFTTDQDVDELTLLFKRQRARIVHPRQNAGTAHDPARQRRNHQSGQHRGADRIAHDRCRRTHQGRADVAHPNVGGRVRISRRTGQHGDPPGPTRTSTVADIIENFDTQTPLGRARRHMPVGPAG